MKLKEILLTTQPHNLSDLKSELGQSWETPMRLNAFDITDDEKIKKIESHITSIMETLGLDLSDDSLSGTPNRVATMYVNEVFSGLNPKNKPHVRLFENKYNYDQMLVEKDITFYTHCEHHLVPIYGRAHVAYFSNSKVIGLSKINRIVQYFSKRPQVQERLTVQIGKEMEKILDTDSVAVAIDANHLCVAMRGVGDTNSKTGTAYFTGRFKMKEIRKEFLDFVNNIG